MKKIKQTTWNNRTDKQGPGQNGFRYFSPKWSIDDLNRDSEDDHFPENKETTTDHRLDIYTLKSE